MTSTSLARPILVEEVEVRDVELLSPSFVRIELAAPSLAEFGSDEPLYDQRIKLIFPEAGRPLVAAADLGENWYGDWLAVPEEERGQMRTYTVRSVRGAGAETRVVVDFVLHGSGAHGPGGDWAARAQPGDTVILVGPRRGHVFGGVEFVPGDARRMLLVGDETAVPAVAAILEQLPTDTQGAVFLEVPVDADRLSLEHPPAVELTWLPRNGAARGHALHEAVVDYLGGQAQAADEDVPEAEIDPDLWETPSYSSSGEDVDAARAVGHEWHGLYAWIAGESKVVTGLRRALVRDLELDRHQVAFMGYWREGVAMKG